MAKEGFSPAGKSGFETDISQQEVENLMRGLLQALLEEQNSFLLNEIQPESPAGASR